MGKKTTCRRADDRFHCERRPPDELPVRLARPAKRLAALLLLAGALSSSAQFPITAISPRSEHISIVTVQDAKTLQSMAGVSFILTGPNGFRLEGTTNGDGVAELNETLPPGLYAVRVRAPTYREGLTRFRVIDFQPNLSFFLRREKPVEPGIVPHRIADQVQLGLETALLEIGSLLSPFEAGRWRLRRTEPISDPGAQPLLGPYSTFLTLDRDTATRQRWLRRPFATGPSVPITSTGSFDVRGVVVAADADELEIAVGADLGSDQAWGVGTFFNEGDGPLPSFETVLVDSRRAATPITGDRDGEPRLFLYDEDSRRWTELGFDGGEVVSGGFDRPASGSQLGENTGGLQPQAVATSGGGTLLFTSRTSGSIPSGFSCIGGTSRQFFTRFDEKGRVLEDREIAMGSFSTQVGQSCFPPHSTESSELVYGKRWGVTFQSGSRILLATTELEAGGGGDSLDLSEDRGRVASSGVTGTTPTVFELSQQPSSLDGVFFWRPGVLGDPDNGSFLIDLPNGPTFEGSEDGERLGFEPWLISNDAFDLPLVASGQLLRHALTVDLSGAPWRLGTFERRELDGNAPAGELVVAEVPLPGCLDTGRVLCLTDNRFAVSARYRTAASEEGDATARSLSNGAGTFWFFEPDNRELIVKVLDACGVNGHYWFFAAGLTDVGVQLQLSDPETGIGNLYFNPVGQPFEPILDTEALACSEIDGLGSSRGASATSAAEVPTPRRLGDRATSGGAACGGDADDLCLADGRFRVAVDYTDFAGATSPAFGGNLTEDTGALFFFDRSNVEMLVKVLDACAFGNYWVFAAGLTNLGVDLRVTDTVTGMSEIYSNPLGVSFRPIADTGSFPCS